MMFTPSRYLSLGTLPMCSSLHLRVGSPYYYLEPGFLSDALQQLPLLKRLVIRSWPSSGDNKLSWPALKTILTTPHLRELWLSVPSIVRCTAEELDAVVVPPLTSLVNMITLNACGDSPPWHPIKRDIVAMLAEKASASLQHLEICGSEPLPLDTLRGSYWPCLRDLTLRGEARPHPEMPYIIALGNMPELRSLTLALTLRPRTSSPIIWPSGYNAACPWPYLQTFAICHPNLKDDVYPHLPPTLQRLILCAPSCQYDIVWE